MAVTGTGTQVIKVTSSSDVVDSDVTGGDSMFLAKLHWGGVGTAGDDIKVTASISGQSVVIWETKGSQYSDNELSFEEWPCGFVCESLTVNTLDSGNLFVYLR